MGLEESPSTTEQVENGLAELNELTAISPVDGRYAGQLHALREHFSEFALIRGRIEIEIKYLHALSEIGLVRKFTEQEKTDLDNVYLLFNIDDAQAVKKIEATTRHDVKSMEYFLKGKLQGSSLEDVLEMVHFALTSEDVTNLAQNLAIQRAKTKVLLPTAWGLIDTIGDRAKEWQKIPILGRSHGREAPATPLGKELALYGVRLANKAHELGQLQLTGKLTGVMGNFHELQAAAPEIDWIQFSINFVKSLGLEPQVYTTQIEPHDRWARMLNIISEMMTILESTDQNLWAYLSHDYFFLPPRKGQIGSSVMPHKGRNPIDLENSEGNAIFTLGLCQNLARELPNSRFQRHLSDSTLARNFGVVFGHMILALANAQSDIKDLQPKEDVIKADLEHKWAIVTSGIQTRLRFLGVKNPYEMFDELAKTGPITKERLHTFVDSLPIADQEKVRFKTWTPENYLGEGVRLTYMMLNDIRDLKAARKL